jgi:hypothetical protein
MTMIFDENGFSPGIDITSDIEAQLDELDPDGLTSVPADPEWDDEPSFDRSGRRIFLRRPLDTSPPSMR